MRLHKFGSPGGRKSDKLLKEGGNVIALDMFKRKEVASGSERGLIPFLTNFFKVVFFLFRNNFIVKIVS